MHDDMRRSFLGCHKSLVCHQVRSPVPILAFYCLLTIHRLFHTFPRRCSLDCCIRLRSLSAFSSHHELLLRLVHKLLGFIILFGLVPLVCVSRFFTWSLLGVCRRSRDREG